MRLTCAPHRRARERGTYVTGDFHNHTTCSDGSISMQKLVKKSTDKSDTPWGLDWFVQAGHGGNGNRNCTLAEDATLATPAYPLVYATDGTTLLGPNTSWQNTNPAIAPKGRVQGNRAEPGHVALAVDAGIPVSDHRISRRAQEHAGLHRARIRRRRPRAHLDVRRRGPAPGRLSTSRRCPRAPGYSPLGNATALAKWSYCFDRGDTDTSRGNTTVGGTDGNNWDCSVTGSAQRGGSELECRSRRNCIPASGAGTGDRGHAKTVEAMKWMAQKYASSSYYVPAHLERAGPFNPNGNNGFNIEHLRNFNNAAPTVAFGMERSRVTAPRMRAVNTPFIATTSAAPSATSTASAAPPGAAPACTARQIGGVWDALLGEGRNWWFFASSDWHNRGMFGPDDRRSSQDFYPGEYQRDYVMVNADERQGPASSSTTMTRTSKVLTPAAIVDGLRTGNSWAASGQLIDRLAFVACVDDGQRSLDGRSRGACTRPSKNTDVDLGAKCATMGEKLGVRPGHEVVVADRRARSVRHELLAVHLRESVARAGRHLAAAEQAGARSHRRDWRQGHGLQDAGRG